MVESTGVRGPTLARLATVLVLLSIGNTPALRVTLQAGRSLLYELLLSIGNTPALRVITLREGRILPLYESLARRVGVFFLWESNA